MAKIVSYICPRPSQLVGKTSNTSHALDAETIERCAAIAEANSDYVSDHPYYAPQDRARNATRKGIAAAIRAEKP